MTCEADFCDKKRGFTKLDGTCFICEPYLVPVHDRRECISPMCPENAFVTADGNCQPCDKYEILTPKKEGCQKGAC
jgi:hypothetical protein